MARRPIPSFSILWQRHESIYCDIFYSALELFSKDKKLSGDEDALSERLCPYLNQICYKMSSNSDIEIRTPDWEKPKQPVNEDELTGGKVRKRPDFTCKYTNPTATSEEEYEICLHVECKCLGNPTSKSWILNKNYVVNGIKRFDSNTHEYGKRAPSGIMIGYIITMEPEQILQEINQFQKRYLPQNSPISFTFGCKKLHKTNQHLIRQSIKPREFKIIHLWVDLRENYN